MGEQPIVPDTSLLLYLGRIEKVDLLPILYKEIYVPEKVVQELDAGCLFDARTLDDMPAIRSDGGSSGFTSL